jgi:glycosyltransferase involved in cell wall biosynthesis
MNILQNLKGQKKIVIVMPAYNAAKTLKATIEGIPESCYDEIILVDDHSADDTVAVAEGLVQRILVHDVNRGYGANQKTCYRAALDAGADIIVLLHPDNQYNPRIIPNMILPLLLDQADIVFASRFIQDPRQGGPLAQGMPLLKYVVNKLLTTVQNGLMGTFFSEFHTGYRAYTREVMEKIDVTKLSDDFVFDNQIIAPMLALDFRFRQIGVETRYFKEASSINFWRGVLYAAGCLNVGWRYFLHRKGLKSWDFLEESLVNSKNL